MNKRWGTVIALIVMAIGLVFCFITDYPVAECIGLALTMFGAGVACNQFYEARNKSKPKWMAIAGNALISIGAFILGVFQFDKDTFSTYITLVFGVIAIIAGIIINKVTTRE